MSGQQAACCKEQQHNKWKQPPLTEIRFWEQIWTWWAEGSDWVVDSEHVRGVLGAKPLRALLTKRRIFRVILCYIQCFSVVKCTCKDSGCGIVIWRPLSVAIISPTWYECVDQFLRVNLRWVTNRAEAFREMYDELCLFVSCFFAVLKVSETSNS